MSGSAVTTLRFVFGLLLLAPAPARAQPTGYELALQGSDVLHAGRTAVFRGVAYRVHGLAELRPQGGDVEARLRWSEGERPSTSWVTARADAAGRFRLELPVPEAALDPSPVLEVRVGGEAGRRFSFPVRVAPALDVLLRTDRRLYEPGEPVHAWALVRDAASGAPARDVPVELRLTGGALPPTMHALRTSEAGVVHLELRVPERAPESGQQIALRIEGQLQQRATFRVGTRTSERLFATVETPDAAVTPGASTTVSVSVTTPSGAPVSGATVRLTIEDEVLTGSTGDDGVARLEVRAPAHFEHRSGHVSVQAEVEHPAHGAVTAWGALGLAVPLALRVEVVPRHGGLVPEVDDALYVRLIEGTSGPPAEGTEVTVRGPAIQGGSFTGASDAHGLVEVPVRLPLGAASSLDGAPETTVTVDVAGPLERTTEASIPVLRDVEVAPVVGDVVMDPGGAIEVRLLRRPAWRRAEVRVELLDGQAPLDWVVTRADRVRLTPPPGRLGVLHVRARVLHEDETLDGVGALAAVLVRPPDPDEARLSSARPRWTVGDTAQLTLHTGAGGPRRWAALLVRDLAAHGGEEPFRASFLGGAFERAVRAPTGPASERLLRAALAAHANADPATQPAPPLTDALGLPEEGAATDAARERGTLRDPFPLARELERRGAFDAMRALESALEEALSEGGLDAITTGAGARRRFRDDLLAAQTRLRTLGDEPLTPSILEDAVPGFDYEAVARRVARARLVRLMAALARYLDPGDDAPVAARMASREPSERWLGRMVERGVIAQTDLDDPWGGRFTLRASRAPLLVLGAAATALELVSPGPDGRPGTRDDVRDPFARVVPAATPYAIASGEDALMRQLAMISPLARTLEALREAYRRTLAEMAEELIGDAVAGGYSEGSLGLGGLGTVGHGRGGGGSGYGSGSGYGRMGRRGRIRVGSAGLAGVVRERFPPTLLFRPALVVDADGTTELAVPLADAVTTYLVEAIVWREDGWIDSAELRVEVDRDVVIEAPVPPLAHRGDVLSVPVRVSNRGDAPRALAIGLLGDAALAIEDGARTEVTLAPGEAEVVRVEVRPTRIGEGRLTAVALDAASGETLDAVRRPMQVVAPARRVERERTGLAAGDVTLALEAPAGADPRDGRVRLVVGPALFPADGPSDPWAAWAPPPGWTGAARARSGGAVERAFALGARVRRGLDHAAGASRREAAALTRALSAESGGQTEGSPAQLRLRAWALLGLSPAARDDAPADVRAILDGLRRDVASGAMLRTDDPASWVVAAAALGWSGGDRERVAELVRRLERHAVEVGEDRWLVTEGSVARATLLWAMAELSLDRRQRAFDLLSTVARFAASGHALDAEERALGRAAMGRLLDGAPPTEAEVWIDGERQTVTLTGGAAEVDAPALARPGAHEVRVRVAERAPLHVAASARYGVAWEAAPRGPFGLEVRGATHGLDETAELELVLRNRLPRTVPAVEVQVGLPTGAELTERERQRIGVPVERGGGVLTLHLPAMRPGQTRTVRLPLRWSVAGRLEGLGVAAWAVDRPDGVSVLAPRVVEVSR